MKLCVPNKSIKIYPFHIIYIRRFLLSFPERYVGFQVFLINTISDPNIRLSSFSVYNFMGKHLIQCGFVVHLA